MLYKQEGGWLIGLVLVVLLGGIGHSAAGNGLNDPNSGIIALGSKLPTPDFTFAPASPLDRLTVVQFLDRSEDPDGRIVSWKWDFGDGTAGCPPDCGVGTEQNPTHEYAREGTYTVTLTVTDNSGLVNTISKEIIVGKIGIPILITGSILPEILPRQFQWEYSPRSFTVHFQRGERIILSRLPNGTEEIFVHTTLVIKVTHPNGTIAGKTIEFCDLPFCGCRSKGPFDITTMFEPGKNYVSVTLYGGCGFPISSTNLYLVKFARTSAVRLIGEMTGEIAELQREIATLKSSWNARMISRKLDLASRYAYYCALRPRLCQMAQTLLNKAIGHLNNIDFGKVIEWVKAGLPELRGELEVLIMLNEAMKEPGEEVLREIEELYKLLCSMDPSAADCGATILDPIIWPWPEIRKELERIKAILQDAHARIPDDPTGAMRLIHDARGLLPLPLGEIEEHWRGLDGRLTQLREKGRLLRLALRRERRHSQEAQGFSLALYPNPITSGLPTVVRANGIDAASIELQVFALDGGLVLDKRVEGSYLQFHPLDDKGRPLANGVYLYVVTVRGYDGTVIKSEVRKLVILR